MRRWATRGRSLSSVVWLYNATTGLEQEYHVGDDPYVHGDYWWTGKTRKPEPKTEDTTDNAATATRG